MRSRFVLMAGLALLLGACQPEVVPAKPVVQAGEAYARLSTKAESSEQLVVRDFFWYGCAHCYSAVPDLEKAYAVLKSKGVAVEHVPVPANTVWTLGAKAYYALKAQGLTDAQHKSLFEAIHGKKLDPVNPAKKEDFLKWAGQAGFDVAKLDADWESSEIASKVSEAQKLSRAYGLTGTPAVGVGGVFLVTGESSKGDMGRAVLKAVAELQADTVKEKK